jgi:hypothetical protein
VITDDEIVRLFQLADPDRHDDATVMVDAAGYLEALQTRSDDMTLIDTAEAPPRNNKWQLPTLIAAAIILVVAGSVLLTRGDGESVPLAPPTTIAPVAPTTAVEPVAVQTADDAIAVVRSYYDARAAYDTEGALSLLTDEAIATGSWGSPEKFRSELELSRAIKAQALLGDCTPVDGQGRGITIRCDFDVHDLRSEELGLGPFGDNSTEVVIVDGKISSIVESSPLETNGFIEQIWDPFSDWVAAKHAGDGEAMYGDRVLSDGPSEESIELFQQRSREWVDARLAAERVSTQFLEAFAAFDADAAGSYLADGASTERIIGEDVQDYREAIALYQAWGYEQTLGACSQVDATATGLKTRCPFRYHLLGSRELGSGPYDGSYFTVTVDDETALITKVESTWGPDDFSRSVAEPFTNWVTTNFPNDAAVMSNGGGPALTSESLALWDQHRREYVQHVQSNTSTTTAA